MFEKKIMKNILPLFILFSFCQLQAQERIDGAFAFQTDPAKKYSIYVPANYDAAVPHKLMLAFHPLNTSRWNAESWCDTLIQFSATNNLLMICPDGGADGAVDDPIDTAFTSVLLDSMMQWYNIDTERIWSMGFSWGGRTTYSYGLRNAEKFAGFIPIGSAITGTDQVDGFLGNAKDKPFYIIHGGNDNPSVRFTPMVDALMNAEACVFTNLLPGVGHTIDFPNRNQILSDAFQELETIVCNDVSAVEDLTTFTKPVFYPNPIESGGTVILPDVKTAILYSNTGKLIGNYDNGRINTLGLAPGVYFLQMKLEGVMIAEKLIIH